VGGSVGGGPTARVRRDRPGDVEPSPERLGGGDGSAGGGPPRRRRDRGDAPVSARRGLGDAPVSARRGRGGRVPPSPGPGRSSSLTGRPPTRRTGHVAVQRRRRRPGRGSACPSPRRSGRAARSRTPRAAAPRGGSTAARATTPAGGAWWAGRVTTTNVASSKASSMPVPARQPGGRVLTEQEEQLGVGFLGVDLGERVGGEGRSDRVTSRVSIVRWGSCATAASASATPVDAGGRGLAPSSTAHPPRAAGPRRAAAPRARTRPPRGDRGGAGRRCRRADRDVATCAEANGRGDHCPCTRAYAPPPRVGEPSGRPRRAHPGRGESGADP
jgi:hypothetical protein